jgi:serine/threonine protein phosphatase PrpC
MELLCDADEERVADRRKRVEACLQTPGYTNSVKAHKVSSLLRFQVGFRLDRGIVCKNQPNEDCLFIAQSVFHPGFASASRFAMFVVADGMGGQEYGQEASLYAMQSLTEYVYSSLASQDPTPDICSTLLRQGVQYANQAVYQLNQTTGFKMGTTMTALLVNDLTAYIAHAGDSRAYLYRKPDGLRQLTHDHSLVAALIEVGAIKPEEAYQHPGRNQIYRYLGQRQSLEVETHVVSLAVGDTVLLCSDGLWEMVRDPQIADILAQPAKNPAAMADRLVQAALTGGGEDNIGVIVARV